jgi:cytochrome P450
MVQTGTTSQPTADRRRPPRLAGLPVLGSALDLRRDYLGTLLRAQATGAGLVRMDAGPPGWRTTLYAVFAPDGVERVLANAPDRLVRQTPGYVELRNTIGDGLLTSEGETWHRQRRLVAPAFTRRRLVPGYADAVGREAGDLVARWVPAAASGAAVDAHGEMVSLTARVIGRVLFGTDVGDALPRLTRIGPFVNALLLRRSVTPHPSPRWLPTGTNRRLAAAAAEMRDIVDGIVAQRSREAEGAAGTPAGRRQANLLDLLLAAREAHAAGGGGGNGEPLTEAEVADQVLVFLLAGHETTATTLACALVLLAQNPQWQQVLQEEVDAVVGERPVTGADVPALVQVDHVVRETLRLYPAAHTVGRRAPHGDVLLGHRIPPGGNVIVSPWATQRSPVLWPNPDRFDPERFAVPEPGGTRYAWFPFGAGPHACIGAQLAMLEATMVLASLVQAFRFDTDVTDIPLLAGISLRPAVPLPLRLTTR